MIDRPAVMRLFGDEARELLIDMESLFLELEQTPDDRALVARVFRTMHTLKGSGAMFGYTEAARVAHALEDVFDRVRHGRLPLTSELLGLCLEAKDHLQTLLEGDPADVPVAVREASDALMLRIAAFEHDEADVDDGQAVHAAKPYDTGVPEHMTISGDATGEDEVCLWVRLTPADDWMWRGLDPLRLLDSFRGYGPFEVVPVFADGGLEHVGEVPFPVRWEGVLTGRVSADVLRQDYAWLLDSENLSIMSLGKRSDCPPVRALLSAAVGGRVNDPLALMAAARAMEREDICNCMDVQSVASEVAQAAEASSSSIRVESAKLDRLVGFVVELVILQSRLSQLVRGVPDDAMREVAEGLERLAGSLRDSAMSMRMVPMGSTFHSFRRLVRDLAAQLGKKVLFEAEGGDTELDKTLIDQLRDPLLHLLRNAMDHGIEPPEVRLATGKPEEGVVRLGASHSGGEVHIYVSDDGAGVDLEKVRLRAVAMGLIPPETEPDTATLLALLYVPGFTTAPGVSEISGRGVGMDVVHSAIAALRGSLDMETTPGRGTTCHIRLPLTLAIIDGMRVLVGGDSYIVPLTMVEACLERFVDGAVRTVECIEYRGRLIPCVSLRLLLGVPGEQPGYERVIVAGKEGHEVGFAVDAVVGLQQAVIKGVGNLCRNVAWISGTTVDADGGISLILDVVQLIRFAVGSVGPEAHA
ncbi:chemotaxis protein CheA [Nitratidesulfovibrio vulgaris]|uniref:chemotaxis protein CheA n=1 Tax=Nitratidesulfovibrio vulgaris TaxID=881 RepID=UPI0013E0BD0F|nr:chemotaxis protein CheA [Nitratidesulfovibrio vulgaris]